MGRWNFGSGWAGAFGLGVVLLGSASCGSDSQSAAERTCSIDDDCGSGRICVSGLCVDDSVSGDIGADARTDTGVLPDTTPEDVPVRPDVPVVPDSGPDVPVLPDAGPDGTPDVEGDASVPDSTPDAGEDAASDVVVEPGGYQAPCTSDGDCDSGKCIEGENGRVCTIVCNGNEVCGDGWLCEPLRMDATVTYCWPEGPRLCEACTSDDDCGNALDSCVTVDETTHCGRACRDRACPTGYTCRNVRGTGGRQSQQCVPEADTCAGCIDEDNDGYGVGAECLGPDCDDTNEDVNPGASEVCDGVDNDCNGIVDGMTRACYGGPEGTEGIGACTGGVSTCVDGEFGGCEGEVVPSDEVCDGADNDCDGATDGFSVTCYGGPEGSAGVGVCVAGTRTCTDGAFGACDGEVVPSDEVCDGADNDCDGEIDGIVEDCYSGPEGTAGTGVCAVGSRTCTDGAFGACTNEVVPTPEVCDRQDNDCDGISDAYTESCYSGPSDTAGVGLCTAGTRTCGDGAFGICEGEVVPDDEVCDGEDNDCDGLVDGIVESCYDGPGGTAGVGQCVAGRRTCDDAVFGACEGQQLPDAETCDGIDNDCDGTIDGFAESCYSGPAGTAGVGLCRAGSRTCSAGAFGSCGGEVLPATEICDGSDNDCDGTVDEGCDCINGATQSCYTGPSGTAGVGLCRSGTQTCVNGRFGACQGEVRPSAEVCDGADNDCDGSADEDVTRTCYEGPAGTQGRGVCRAGVQACVAGQFAATCSGQVLPSAEVCDAEDNDCDGTVDGFAERCYGGPDGTAGVGICRQGSRTCTSGTFGACNGEVLPNATEICGNGLDDNCSGASEEGCALGISAASAVTASSACLTRATGARAAITVTLVDTAGNPVNGATVTMQSTAGSISQVTSSGNTYRAVLTAPATGTTAQVTVSASNGGAAVVLTTRPSITLADPLPAAVVEGGAAGCPVDGNLRVRVIRGDTLAPLQNAFVMVGASESASAYVTTPGAAASGANTGRTDSDGYVTFVDFGSTLRSPATVTAASATFAHTTYVGMNASDMTLVLTPQRPPGSTGVLTGDVSNVEGGSLLGGPSVGAALVVGNVFFRDIAAFSLDTLLADSACYTAAGNTLAIPKNIFVPSQLLGQAPKRPFDTAPLPYGSQRLTAISVLNSINTFTGDGGIAAALGSLSFRRLGFADANLQNARQTQNVGLPNQNNLSARLNCTVTNAPAVSDTFCVAVGDHDSLPSASLEPGEGRLFIMGLKAVTASAQGAANITGVTGVARTGSFQNIDYVAASLALYLDEERSGIPAGTSNGLSAIFSRRTSGGTAYNFGTGTTTVTFNNYMPIRSLTRTGRQFGFTSANRGPTPHYGEFVIRRSVTESYTTCPGQTDTREVQHTLWRVYTAGDATTVTLPTIPSTWPTGNVAGEYNGLVDPATLSATNKLSWRHTVYHEGDLAVAFQWNRLLIGRQPRTVTHLTSNSLDW